MTATRRSILQASAAIAGLSVMPGESDAQTRAETIRYVTGNTINTLDCTVLGATRESFGLAMSIHDRLFKFGRKQVGDHWTFDATEISGELAQGYTISDDGLLITITLRPDAVWHDGSKVTVYFRKPQLRADGVLPAGGIARFYGVATIHKSGAAYEEVWRRLVQPEKDRDPDKKGFAVLIKIERAEDLNGAALTLE